MLVVDDQPDVADSFAGVLERLGQQVKVAYSGEMALELARQQRPDVAFVDLMMPGVDGAEVARNLRKKFPASELTIVVVTGKGTARVAPNSPFDRLMLKPISAEDVTAVLNSLPRRKGHD